jgi:glycosyltransferase involved in cell wall biosynthesis
MEEYKSNKKVLYIKHDYNKNGSAARNTGVSYSKAKYLCLLDDDDEFLKDRIRKQVLFLENNSDYKSCYCWRKQNGKEICGTFEGDLTKQLLDLSFSPTTSAIMLTRDSYNAIGGFDESYRRHQDYEFLLRYFKKYKMGVVKEILLDFIGNDVNNQLKGKKLYDLKRTFFKQFNQEIEDIDKRDKGFKKRVYAAHFSETCKELLRYGNFWLAVKTYFIYGIKGGLLFWKLFFMKIGRGIKKKIKNQNK